MTTQPLGSLCRNCMYRAALPHRRYPHLARLVCSDRCAEEMRHRGARVRLREEANAVRDLIGLPAAGSGYFTVPELQAMRRRITRLVPGGGLSRYPARVKRHAS